MAALTDLDEILASLDATVRGDYVYCVLPTVPDGVTPLATVAEDEGLTVVVPLADAERLGLSAADAFTCITLNVHSALDSVGLTAAVSTLLAEHDISCNVIAGFHHDHLLVPVTRGHEALTLLTGLSAGTFR